MRSKILLLLFVSFILASKVSWPIEKLGPDEGGARTDPYKEDLAEQELEKIQNKKLTTNDVQLFILVDANAAFEKTENNLLKADVSIVAKQKSAIGLLIVARSEKLITGDVLQKLKKIEGIKWIQRDSDFYLQKNGDGTHIRDARDCNCENEFTPGEINLKAIESLTADISAKKCFENTKCENNGMSMSWASERVDADIAEMELTNIHKGSVSSVRIAVVDTGFHNDPKDCCFMRNSPVKFIKGWDGASDPEEDYYGHGTAVTSVIGGKRPGGVTSRADISVYSTTAGIDRTTSYGLLVLAIEKACADGNQIINVSFSGNEEIDADILKSFSDRGCLLIFPAGNKGDSENMPNLNKSKGPILFVEAEDFSGVGAKESYKGNIMAPGENVFAYLSPISIVNTETKVKNLNCAKTSTGFVNGTSFAAPVVSAIAAQVMSALSESEVYNNFKPENKILLVKHILGASTRTPSGHYGGTNAMRAVAISNIWMKSNSPRVLSEKELERMLAYIRDPVCAEKSSSCLSAPSSCENLKTCVFKQRKKAALCAQENRQTVSALFDAMIETKQTEQAAYYYRQLLEGKNVLLGLKPTVSKLWPLLRERWASYPKNGRNSYRDNLRLNVDYSLAINVLPIFINQQLNARGNDTNTSKEALRDILLGEDTIRALATEPAEDGGKSFIIQALQGLDGEAFSEIIKEVVSVHSKFQTTESQHKIKERFTLLSRALKAMYLGLSDKGVKVSIKKELINLIKGSLHAGIKGLEDEIREIFYDKEPGR